MKRAKPKYGEYVHLKFFCLDKRKKQQKVGNSSSFPSLVFHLVHPNINVHISAYLSKVFVVRKKKWVSVFSFQAVRSSLIVKNR